MYHDKKFLDQITGTLSKPSKMPCHSYSIPAQMCKTGSKLRDVEGTPCSNCYAMKGRYNFPNVKAALMKRYLSLDDPRWVDAMCEQIARTHNPYFRWHDSGDLQSPQHLRNIIEIATRLPRVSFWLPTLETKIVNEVCRTTYVPSNLSIRLSSTKINSPVVRRFGYNTSSVINDLAYARGHVCPAPQQSGKCGDCRACWDKEVSNVCYIEH
jgi:hypothetical protein